VLDHCATNAFITNFDSRQKNKFHFFCFLFREQFKKSAEKYYADFNENAKMMTDSLKKIENIVVEVLNDQGPML
jgi:hypothetical protein